jgi:hypothetical protein
MVPMVRGLLEISACVTGVPVQERADEANALHTNFKPFVCCTRLYFFCLTLPTYVYA